MRLAIIGYGKMGKTVEEIAVQRGHTIPVIVDPVAGSAIDGLSGDTVDAAIEFTTPATAPDNLRSCFSKEIPVVCGTTGWYDHLDAIKKDCLAHDGALIYASNFSIGVQLFRLLNKWFSETMNHYPEYNPHIKEVHHIHKKDAPSGTAITLAEDLLSISTRKDHWVKESTEDESALAVLSERRGEVPGIHSITWDGEDDEITIQHRAGNRSGFARGAVRAAEWLAGKKGIYTITDMLNS